MAAQLGKAASGAAQHLAKGKAKDEVLRKGARRDPELYVG